MMRMDKIIPLMTKEEKMELEFIGIKILATDLCDERNYIKEIITDEINRIKKQKKGFESLKILNRILEKMKPLDYRVEVFENEY